jgi:hypothetical protein
MQTHAGTDAGWKIQTCPTASHPHAKPNSSLDHVRYVNMVATLESAIPASRLLALRRPDMYPVRFGRAATWRLASVHVPVWHTVLPRSPSPSPSPYPLPREPARSRGRVRSRGRLSTQSPVFGFSLDSTITKGCEKSDSQSILRPCALQLQSASNDSCIRTEDPGFSLTESFMR